MPLGDLAGEALGGIFRFVGRVLAEVFFEFLIKGAGYVVIRLVRPHSKPGDAACAIAGLVFWALAGSAGYIIYRTSVA